MKRKALSSIFVLFAIAAGIVAMTPAAFADHSEVTIGTVEQSGFGQDCVTDGCYIPSTATVDVGGKVIMTNTDSTGPHTFTSGFVNGFAPNPDGIFDSGLLMTDESLEWVPETVGEVTYYCSIHTWMIGTIIVQEVEDDASDDHDDVIIADLDTIKDGDVMENGEDMMENGEDMMENGEDMMENGEDMMKNGEDMMKNDEDMMKNDDASATGMLSDGTMVSVWTSTPTAGEMMEISIGFADAEHVNHDITVTQNGKKVLADEGAHSHDGKGVHTTAALDSSDPVDVTVTFQGYGVNDPKTGPIGEEVVFTNIVPEFGTIAMMILAVAIISIVALTTKSRVIPRF